MRTSPSIDDICNTIYVLPPCSYVRFCRMVRNKGRLLTLAHISVSLRSVLGGFHAPPRSIPNSAMLYCIVKVDVLREECGAAASAQERQLRSPLSWVVVPFRLDSPAGPLRPALLARGAVGGIFSDKVIARSEASGEDRQGLRQQGGDNVAEEHNGQTGQGWP